MIILDCKQGTPVWERARLGLPTSSGFSNIVTPKQLKPSKSAEPYLCELLAEWATGHALEPWVSPWAERGKKLEPEARRFLAFELGREIQKVGFIYRDEDRMTGCSPDGLTAEPVEGVELKCPAAKTHIGYMLSPSDLLAEYWMQVQGGLWVTGLPRWHVCSYYPGLPEVLKTVEPDPQTQDALNRHVPAFIKRLRNLREQVKEMGVVPKLDPDPTALPEWALPSVDHLQPEHAAP